MMQTTMPIGHEYYQNHLRAVVETPENVGRIIALDPDSGDYEIDDDPLLAGLRLKQRRPDAALWAERIGYDAVYSFGPSSLHRTEK